MSRVITFKLAPGKKVAKKSCFFYLGFITRLRPNLTSNKSDLIKFAHFFIYKYFIIVIISVCVYYYSYMYHDLISTVCITDHTDSTYMNRPRPADIVTNKENPTQNTFFAIFLVTFFEEKKNKQNLDFKGLKRLLFFCVYFFCLFA